MEERLVKQDCIITIVNILLGIPHKCGQKSSFQVATHHWGCWLLATTYCFVDNAIPLGPQWINDPQLCQSGWPNFFANLKNNKIVQFKCILSKQKKNACICSTVSMLLYASLTCTSHYLMHPENGEIYFHLLVSLKAGHRPNLTQHKITSLLQA